MAKKVAVDKNIKEIKKFIKTGELVIGTDMTLKNLRRGHIAKVFTASNCNESVKKDLIYYSRLNNAEFVEMQYANEDIGVICKKPFSISVISIIKGAK